MHDWLQTNALATSLGMLKTRMETMSSCDLILGLTERIQSGFNLDRFRTIWPHDDLIEASHNESLVAHERFLDSLLNEDFTLGTHQGPMLPSHRLSGYVWEDTKLAHFVPSWLLPANRPQA